MSCVLGPFESKYESMKKSLLVFTEMGSINAGLAEFINYIAEHVSPTSRIAEEHGATGETYGVKTCSWCVICIVRCFHCHVKFVRGIQKIRVKIVGRGSQNFRVRIVSNRHSNSYRMYQNLLQH